MCTISREHYCIRCCLCMRRLAFLSLLFRDGEGTKLKNKVKMKKMKNKHAIKYHIVHVLWTNILHFVCNHTETSHFYNSSPTCYCTLYDWSMCHLCLVCLLVKKRFTFNKKENRLLLLLLVPLSEEHSCRKPEHII